MIDYKEGPDTGRAADPDFLAITRYLGGTMSADEARALEERADSDSVFWDKVGPAVALQALLQVGAEPAPMEPALATYKPAPVRSGSPRPSALNHQPHKWRNRIYIGLGSVATGVIGCFVLLVAAAKYPPLMHVLAKGLAHVMVQDTTNTLAHEAYRDVQAGRSTVPGGGTLVNDSTGPGETRTFKLGFGSWVVVRPNSRLAYRIPKGALQSAADFLAPHEVTVDGDVVLTTYDQWTVHTRFATITVQAGIYAIRSVPRSTEMRLSVGRGYADVLLRGASHDDVLHLGRGDYLAVPSTGEIHLSHDSTGFPTFGDTATTPVRKKP